MPDRGKIAPRDQVMNQLWESVRKGLTVGDFREMPRIIFEDLEPIFEACYEAGQDSQAEFEERLRLRARGVTDSTQDRLKFSGWWLSSGSEGGGDDGGRTAGR